MCKQSIKVLTVFVFLFFTTGCWDRVEIEERGFVVAVAFDLPEEKEPGGKQQIVLTQQLVVPGVLAGGGSNLGGGGTEGDAYLNITSEGKSVFGIIRETAARTSRSPYYEHNALIIISEEVARSDQFAEILDHFMRYPEMRGGTKVMISKGRAQSILEVEPKNERLPAMYIDSISINNFKNARMLPVSRLGDVHEHLLKEQSYTIQRIIGEDQEVEISGNTVFQGHNNKLLGFLGKEDTMGLNFLTEEVKGGIVEVGMEKEKIINYEIKKAKRKIEANVDDIDNMTFTFTIETEGNLAEAYAIGLDYEDSKMASRIEQNVAQEIERKANNTAKELQQKLKADVMGLGTYLNNRHFDLWQQIKGDWDRGKNYFSRCKIEVKTNVIVRQPGTVIESNKRN
jgi:spore germination protein